VTVQQQRREERRRDQLESIERQVKAGTLVVRRMTAAERKKFPARPRVKRARSPFNPVFR
jgi:hypothetical protein